MPNAAAKKPFIVIDQNNRSLFEDSGSGYSTSLFLHVTSDKEVSDLLNNQELSFSGVFLNPAIPAQGGTAGLAMLRKIHQLRPVTPVYLVFDHASPPLSDTELNRLAVHASIRKPMDAAQKKELLKTALNLNLTLATDPVPTPREIEQDENISAKPGQFIPVSIHDFVPDTKSFFDVHLQISAEKFVKVLKAGDAFTADRLGTYIQRGLKYLHLSRQALERCLSYTEILDRFLLKNPGVSEQVKIIHVLNQGETLIQAIRKNKAFGDEEVDRSFKFIADIRTAVKQVGGLTQSEIDAFFNDLPAFDHAVGTTMASFFLAKNLGITSEDLSDSVGMASFLHDIGLYKMDDELLLPEDQSKMSSKQKWLYQTHPIRGAELLEKISGISPTTVQAVAQHHERRDSRGFPNRVAAGEINRVAEVVGICDEFVRLIHKGKRYPSLDLFREMEEKIYPGFSLPIVQAFKETFDKK